jgi:hypothetical protein
MFSSHSIFNKGTHCCSALEKGIEVQYSNVAQVKFTSLLQKGEPKSEAEFLDMIGTKGLRVFLLAIHSHLY